jgi:hypothetical protein
MLASQSVAAPKSPYCDMAKSQKNTVAWNEQYGCIDKAQAAAHARALKADEARAARQAKLHPKNSYCNMAKSQKNTVAWNEQYGCIDKAQAAAHARALKADEARAARLAKNQPKDPYCNMAKSQKNLVAWNEQYHCLSR